MWLPTLLSPTKDFRAELLRKGREGQGKGEEHLLLSFGKTSGKSYPVTSWRWAVLFPIAGAFCGVGTSQLLCVCPSIAFLLSPGFYHHKKARTNILLYDLCIVMYFHSYGTDSQEWDFWIKGKGFNNVWQSCDGL